MAPASSEVPRAVPIGVDIVNADPSCLGQRNLGTIGNSQKNPGWNGVGSSGIFGVPVGKAKDGTTSSEERSRAENRIIGIIYNN